MTADTKIECLFYSHVWTIYELENLGFIKTGDELLMELATESRFAPVFDRSEKTSKGIVSLLQPGFSVHKLAFRHSAIKAPIVLAPNPPVAIDHQLAALSLLPSIENHADKVIVLIHVNDAPSFAPAFAIMDNFSIVWDMADFPGIALSALGRSLLNQQCLNKETWKGFFLCNHPNRKLPDIKIRESVLKMLLNEFPVLKAA
ncbi:MAG: hypothetical protein IPN42_05110 [Methylococcaceae bacterium]|nr:hypothetical protein [Methylococcaceae bacterium]